MGTINHNVNIPPKFSPPTNLTELHKEYKEYKLLRKKDQMSSNMNAGSAAYIISTKWLGKYHDFILYDQFEAETSEQHLKIKPNHFQSEHPGIISSAKDLVELDKNGENLFGSNSEAGLEAVYADIYIDQNMK